ncbi:PUA-like domain-containing protein [Podospora australis]|uniref:PUA-like domain-containing protein n=1 Tax=Podospora australis TaxID=1536484 RepID=A0AAN6WWF5_9PEZI|nr:PUA-like domain-containing protein [Podospora australis]
MSAISTRRPDIQAFAAQAFSSLSISPAPKIKDVFSFGGTSPDLANLRLRHAIEGKKTATTSWPVPSPLYWGVGDYSVILDGAGNPAALMQTTEMKIRKFYEVTDDFALAENEGSVEKYKQGHREFYREQWERDGKKGLEFGEESEVLCERFVCVYVREDLRDRHLVSQSIEEK